MYCLSALYRTPNDRFDVEYYTTKHVPWFVGLFGEHCLRWEVTVPAAIPGRPPAPFVAALYVWIDSPDAVSQAIAEHLSKHRQVERVFYPGLSSHKGHDVASKQMKGPGGMISLELTGGLPASTAFLKALKVFVCAESLGGVESLAEHPAIMTHASLEPAARKALGIGDGLLRLSIGLEDETDLREDLERGFRAAAIHGNKSQGQRTRALADFKQGKTTVLVATDIAARGLDIAQLPVVVNYDLPMVAEDYVHRIGRTGRNGASGEALSLVSPDEGGLLRQIQKLLGQDIAMETVPGYEPSRAIRSDARPFEGRPSNAPRGPRPPHSLRPIRSAQRPADRADGAARGRSARRPRARGCRSCPCGRQACGRAARRSPAPDSLSAAQPRRSG